MGFSKTVAPTVEPKPPEQNVGPITADPEVKKVRGQVRMHAIICGFKVAAQLAPTLANTASGIKDELHKLALEVAALIESYSFGGE